MCLLKMHEKKSFLQGEKTNKDWSSGTFIAAASWVQIPVRLTYGLGFSFLDDMGGGGEGRDTWYPWVICQPLLEGYNNRNVYKNCLFEYAYSQDIHQQTTMQKFQPMSQEKSFRYFVFIVMKNEYSILNSNWISFILKMTEPATINVFRED